MDLQCWMLFPLILIDLSGFSVSTGIHVGSLGTAVQYDKLCINVKICAEPQLFIIGKVVHGLTPSTIDPSCFVGEIDQLKHHQNCNKLLPG